MMFISVLHITGRSSGCSHREKPELIALYTMVYFNAFETNSFFKFRRICKIKTQLSKILSQNHTNVEATAPSLQG